ncbi:MAG: hypothetical protein GF403_05710 [Candidatus Coatesbacteria bacterium]|nr:hypothetical protein [Candidatus Coatesbacteria bacterium]
MKLHEESPVTRLFVVRAPSIGRWVLADPGRWRLDDPGVETAAVDVHHYQYRGVTCYEYRFAGKPVVLCAQLEYRENRRPRFHLDKHNVFPVAWQRSKRDYQGFIRRNPGLSIRLTCNPELDYLEYPAFIIRGLPRRNERVVVFVEEILDRL